MILDEQEVTQLKVVLLIALQILEENAPVNERLLEQAREQQFLHIVSAFEKRASNINAQTQAIRNMLARLES